MYTVLKAAIIRNDDVTKNFIILNSEEINSYNVKDLFSQIDQGYLLIEHDSYNRAKVLDLMLIKNEYSTYDNTFSNLLITLANTPLPTVDGTLDIEKNYLRFVDAFAAGFKLFAVTQTGSITEDGGYDDKTWLSLTKEGFNFNLAKDYFLVSINGFLHFNESSSTGMYVQDAMISNKISKESTCGILDFSKLGKLNRIPIKDEMIYSFGEFDLKDKVSIKLNEDIGERKVLLSIGGYLITPNSKAIDIISDNEIVVNFSYYPLVERYVNSRNYLDYSNFNLTKIDINDEAVIVSEILNDSYVKNLLTMTQSFVILLESDHIYEDRFQLEKCLVPGTYVSPIEPIYPVINSFGKIGNYWATREKPYWAIKLVDGLYNNRLYHTRHVPSQSIIDDKNHSFRSYNFNRVEYLHLYTQKINI